MNEVHNVLKTAGIEDQAAKVNPGVGEHPSKQAADPLDVWSATVMRNMKRMATDWRASSSVSGWTGMNVAGSVGHGLESFGCLSLSPATSSAAGSGRSKNAIDRGRYSWGGTTLL